MLSSGVHAVITAAVVAFGFVFLHPFEDGNGRIHRFLIHAILTQRGFTPPGTIFPVSAVMLSKRKQYDEILESISVPMLAFIKSYHLDAQGHLIREDQTYSHYAYLDYTHIVEYLFACLEGAIEEDFQQELAFLIRYDQAKAAIQEIIDMPDRRIDLLIKIALQNKGKLSNKKRMAYVSMVTDPEIRQLEDVLHTAFFC